MTLEQRIAARTAPEDAARAVFLEAVASSSLDRIRGATRRLLAVADSPTRAASFIVSQAQGQALPGLQRMTVALLSSYSIELIADTLWAHGLSEGLDLALRVPGFDRYRQEILDPASGLYADPPDVIVLAVDGPRLAPGLYDDFLARGWRNGAAEVQAVLEDVGGLVRALRSRSTAPVLFHTLLPPRLPALGVVDAIAPNGQERLIGEVNRGLADLAGSIPGFYLVDLPATVREWGYRHWYDPRLAFFARSPIARSALDHLARTYMRFLRALTGRSRKCLVLDLDNTLWGGVLGEEGATGVKLGTEYPGNAFAAFQRAILELRGRGVLLAIASKNNPADVDELFAQNAAMVLKKEHFSARQIHWQAKSLSLQRIAAELNLGLEHLVYVDDNPAECAEVSQALPQVTTIALPAQPERYIEAVLGDGLFDTLSLSAEDARRAELYQQRDAAEELRQAAGTLEEYYRSLEMTVMLSPVNKASIARAAQMTQKTNQFNTTTRRLTEADIAGRLGVDNWITLVAQVTDRFGDNGIVCLAMGEKRGRVLDIETFLMSCRIIGRTVETAILHELAQRARAAGLEAIEGWIIPTKRNPPVRDLYERHGFRPVEEGEDGRQRWRLDLAAQEIAAPEWLRLDIRQE